MILREHIPLKQGLRLLLSEMQLADIPLREHIPLKQGLRLLYYYHILLECRSSESIFH